MFQPFGDINTLETSSYYDLTKLVTWKIQNRDAAASELRTVRVFDIETRDGEMILIANSDGDYLDKITPDNLIEFLYNEKNKSSWNFFYNLTFDAEVILKTLLGTKLKDYLRNRKLEWLYDDIKITYIPKKSLRFMKGKHSVRFFDIAQFYHASLEKAYEDNIGKMPDEHKDFKKKRAQFSKRFYLHNRKSVINYCVNDCRLTLELCNRFIKMFYGVTGFYPNRWLSSGYLAEKYLIHKKVKIPLFNSIPYEIQDLAYKSYYGGRFEITKRGFMGKAAQIDINSAYPYAISLIPDFSDGTWVNGTTIHPKAEVGFFKIEANVANDTYIPQFPFRVNNHGNKIIIFPSGHFVTYVTLHELLASNPESYNILESWQFIPNSNYKPFSDVIHETYNKRLELKAANNPAQLPVKIILNSFYGKFGETVNVNVGNLFNPVLFSFITGFTRAQMYKFVRDSNLNKDVVAFATDSICLRGSKYFDFPETTEIGKFSLKKSADDVFMLQNGYYRFNGIWTSRGFGKDAGKEVEHLKTSVKDGRLYLVLKELRATRLRTAILEKRINDIGRFYVKSKELNLNTDRKRLWYTQLEAVNDRDFCESLPISLDYFSQKYI